MTTATATDWTQYRVGQVLYYVPNHSGRGKESLTVKSVGRKYIRFEETREDCILEKGSTTVQALNYGPIGKVYESEEAYLEATKFDKLRRKLSSYQYTDWLKLADEKALAIAKILGVET